MIDRLVRVLEAARLDLTAEELADALWLVRVQQQSARSPSLPRPDAATGRAPLAEPLTADSRQPEPEGGAEAPRAVTMPPPASVVLPGEQQRALSSVPLQVPAATALPQALELGRALRPLHRRVSSRHLQRVDEVASAEQIAETRLWTPVLRPALVRWFELALVIDAGASMALWRKTVEELQDLLRFHGAFRNVRTWRLLTDSSGDTARLLTGLGEGGAAGVECQPHELTDPSGRRLIMVISDCVSRQWHSGGVSRLLADWGHAGPVVVVQVLPERHWGRTALRNGPAVLLQSLRPGASNVQLQLAQRSRLSPLREGPSTLVPVVTLEKDSLGAWAKLVAGSSASVQGFELRPARVLPPALARAAPAPPPQERVERFLATASAPARKLAGLLATVPVSFPIMRLVRQTMVPEARQEHLAEVYLGGLLRQLPGQENVRSPEETQYDFWPGVRELLLDSVPVGSARTVLLHVSDFIEGRLGRQARDFPALLVDPTKDVTPFVTRHRAFATIAAQVLQRMGGAYAKIAENLTAADSAIRLEAVDDFQDNLGSPVPSLHDWAIVIGVSRYRSNSLPVLISPEREAQAFYAWLTSSSGGGLPSSRVELMLSPSANELDVRLTRLLEARWRVLGPQTAKTPVGRRLYLFLSGHGAEPQDQGPVLFLEDEGADRWRYFPGPRWAQALLEGGLFQEVVLLMDCGRGYSEKLPLEGALPRVTVQPKNELSVSRYLAGFSTTLGGDAYDDRQGSEGSSSPSFTDLVIEGLRGGAVDDKGHVTARELSRFVTRRMSQNGDGQQVPEFEWQGVSGRDFVIAKVPLPQSRVRVEAQRASSSQPQSPNSFQLGMPFTGPSSLPGRERTVQELIHLIERRGSAFLRGPRRSGKTSVLRALAQRLKASHQVRYLSLEEIAYSNRFITLDDLARALDRSLEDEASPASVLRRRLLAEKAPVLLLDEVGLLKNASIDVLRWLRGVSQNGTSIVLAGTHWEWASIIRYGESKWVSPLASILVVVDLGALKESDALEFLETMAPPDVPIPRERTARWIVECCGTWPFYLQAMGYAVVNAVRAGEFPALLERSSVVRLYERYLLSTLGPGAFVGRWTALPKKVQKVLWRLRSSDDGRLPAMQELSSEEHRLLVDTGLYEFSEGWVEDKPFHDWIRRIAPDDLAPDDVEEIDER